MDEKKIVTLEMFEKYHEQLINYITERDGLVDVEETSEKTEEQE